MKMIGWTLIVWGLAAMGASGWALFAAFCALVHVGLVALASLRRDHLCHVCGHRYEIGRLGMCDPCGAELRPVRR